jgi:hypothetical protein
MILSLKVLFAACCLQLVKSECSDPLVAIRTTLDCIAGEDVICASAGYNEAFVKIHNGKDTAKIDIASIDFWAITFQLLDLSFTYDHEMNIGTNRASIRYVEKVTMTDGSSFGFPPSNEYPFGAVIDQYEHALVTVDDDCKMLFWDQYGDNKEQTDVDDAANAILCILGFYPPEICQDLVPTHAPSKVTKQTKKSKSNRKKRRRM